jgi:hypothetical protein
MSGLNAGFELDHEVGEEDDKIVELMFDNTNPGDMPELSGDVDLIAVVKDKITDLGYLKQDIYKAGGMNKSFALEAERLMPGFLNEDRPIGYFTQVATQTQYRETFIALEQEEKSLISRIWESIKEFISKAIEWTKHFVNAFFGKNLEEVDKIYKDKPAEMAESLDKVSDAVKDPKSVIAAVTRLTDDKNSPEFKEYISALETLLVGYENRLKDLYTNINENDYVYAIVSKNKVVDDLLITATRSAAFTDLFEKLISDGLDEATNPKMTVQDLEAGIEKYQKLMKTTISDNKHETFSDIEKDYRQMLKARSTTYSSDNLTLGEIYKVFGLLFKNAKVATFEPILNQVHDRFNALLKAVDSMKSMSKAGDSKNIAVTNRYITWIYTELRSLFTTITMVKGIMGQWRRIALMLDKSAKAFKARVTLGTSKLDEASQKRIKEYFGAAYDLEAA